MDNEHWGDPENFRPERFINNEGKIIQDEWFIPFSLGNVLPKQQNNNKKIIF